MFGRSDFSRATKVERRRRGWADAPTVLHRYAFFPLEFVPPCQVDPSNCIILDDDLELDLDNMPPHRIKPPMEFPCTLLSNRVPTPTPA